MRPPLKLFPSKTLRDMVSERVLPMLLWVLCYAAVTHGAWFGWKDGIVELRNKTLTSIQNNVRSGEDWIDGYIVNLAHDLNTKEPVLFQEKATSTILYCTTGKCDSLTNEIRKEPDLHKGGCLLYIKTPGDYSVDAGMIQKEIAEFVIGCPKGIIFYDAAGGLSMGETNMLIKVLSEGARIYWDGRPISTTDISLFLLVRGEPHPENWGQKELLDTSRQRVYDLTYGDPRNGKNDFTVMSSARALRRRFGYAIPVADPEDQSGLSAGERISTGKEQPEERSKATYSDEIDEIVESVDAYLEDEYDDLYVGTEPGALDFVYAIPAEAQQDTYEDTATPQSEPEVEDTQSEEGQGPEQELPPENVFDMHGLGNALPLDAREPWAAIPVWMRDLDITWPDYVTEMMTSAVVGLTTHGVINWVANRGVLSVFYPTNLLTTVTVSVINNLPSRPKIEGELKAFNESLYDLNQFENISMSGSSTNSQGQQDSQDAWGPKGLNDDWKRLNDTLDEIRKTIYRINEHTGNLKTALDECICESQVTGWGNSHENETFLDRFIKWLTGARDNAVTWMLGTLWDKFGLRAIRSALATGNGWQLVGAAMLLYKVAAWILNVFRNIRKVVMRVVAITQGICWLLRIVWNLMRGHRAQAQQLTQELTTQQSSQEQSPPTPTQQSPPPPSQSPPQESTPSSSPSRPVAPSQSPPPPQHSAPRRADQQNTVTEIHPDPSPEVRQDTEQRGLIQSLMESVQAMQDGLMRRAAELEDRLVNRQGRLEEVVEASILTIGQRVEAVEDRMRVQQVGCELHHPEPEPSHETQGTTERKQSQQIRQDSDKRRPSEAATPHTPKSQTPTRHVEKDGPTVKNVHRMLPKRKENLSQFTRRMSKLLELIDDPVKYATATERIFNIANAQIQARLRGLPWGDAGNWPRVQRIIDECLHGGRNTRSNAPNNDKQGVRQEYGHTCERCNKKGHSGRDCPVLAKAPKTTESGTLGQANPVQRQNSQRMIQYNVPLNMENIAGKISCLLDTGAQTNILPAKLARRHNLVLRSSKVRDVTSFNNQTTRPSGEIALVCTLGKQSAEIPFVVCEGVQRPILGMQALQAFKLQLNCEEDAVYDDKGNKILIHNVSVSKN